MSRLSDEIRDAAGGASDEVAWEGFTDDTVILQRKCPDCDGGLLWAPARFHRACSGSGYLSRTVRRPTGPVFSSTPLDLGDESGHDRSMEPAPEVS